MEKYNQKWVSMLFGKKKWAITLGQTTYYSVSKEEVSREWRWHEECHQIQWYEKGYIKFAITYLWYMLKFGYENNPYEAEARCYVKNVLAGITPLNVPPTIKTA